MGDCDTKITDENQSIELFMTILVNIGNVLSILYNIPQMWRTHKLKKADDISSHFLWMRLSAGIIWSIYCIYYRMWYVIISWTTTIISTTQILYYKYYPSPLAQMPLVELQEFQQRGESDIEQHEQQEHQQKKEVNKNSHSQSYHDDRHQYQYSYPHEIIQLN